MRKKLSDLLILFHKFTPISYAPHLILSLNDNIISTKSNLIFFSGVFVSLFAPLALSCDLLALRGLRSWRKGLLIPWLILYAIIVALVMAVVLTGTFHSGFHWRYLLLGLCCLCFFSAWRQVRLKYSFIGMQYILMSGFFRIFWISTDLRNTS